MGEKQNRKKFVATKKVEKVNHPSHYINKDGKECIDEMIDFFGVDSVITFCKLNAYKYRFRAGLKPGSPAEEDLAKAKWYIDKMNELISQS